MGTENTLICNLSHQLPLFSLTAMIPIIFHPFLDSNPLPPLIYDLSHWLPFLTLITVTPINFHLFGPDPLTLIRDISHCLPLFILIIVIPIILKPFCGLDLLPNSLIWHLTDQNYYLMIITVVALSLSLHNGPWYPLSHWGWMGH